ncbi:MAG: thiamine-phosphate kinase [Campylobacterales bacterium]
MNKEHFFIRKIKRNHYIGDDGAVLPDGLIASMDAFFEEVHFRRSWMSLDQIAAKAMLVNISDQIVMNARPRYALLSVAMPSLSHEEILLLQRGFHRVAKQFNIAIVGGDTIQNHKLDLSITILGESEAPLLRTGLKRGDLIVYTGKLGSVKRDLEKLLNGGTISPRSRFILPRLRPAFVYTAAPLMRVAMDISDGLFSDLERLSELNHCGFAFDKPIPEYIGCSGEEYEVLFGCAPENLPAIRKIAKQTRTPLTVVGRVIAGRFTNPCKAHHFA